MTPLFVFLVVPEPPSLKNQPRRCNFKDLDRPELQNHLLVIITEIIFFFILPFQAHFSCFSLL